MMVPFQVMADFQLKVYRMVLNLAMKNILGLDWVTGPRDMQDLHLLGLKCISQVFSHCSSFCRSCCKVWESFLLVTVRFTAVSSANSLTCELIFSGRSFMYNKNKIGPRTEPWGTPDVTGISDDFSPSRATH